MCAIFRTHKMCAINSRLYTNFGNVLTKLRKQAGIAHQSDLAVMIRVTQQTVSRWEAGLSRPRGKQLSALAKALGADVNELLSAAGYSKTSITVTFDQPFPLEALSAESFERFCFQFLDAYYPGAQVHRAGKSGHAQHGIDIKVRSSDGVCHTFQCKRVQNFGPKNVLSAVAAHTVKSDMKVILLSRIASPKAREAVQLHPEWHIWDKEDISLRIRNLPMDARRRLVDVFFPGQQLALLGDGESGPWQTAEEFFAPFSTGRGLFRHSWKLVGRTREKDELVKALADSERQVVFLIGAGGAGKSRILKEAIADFQVHCADTLVRFLSPTSNISPKSLTEDFGNRKKLIIVDDAHDRTDLQHLFQHASLPPNNTRLLLAFRPYGRDYIEAQAGHFALTTDQIAKVELEGLELAEATALARQVLDDFSGPLNQAEDIGRITQDCPLATVIGAQIVSQKGVHFELAKNEDVFRSTLLGRFRDIVAGRIGNKSDAESLKKLLRIIALLQPFHPEDEALPGIAERIEGLQKYDTKRLIRVLTDGGILFKRGGELRLSPDMLADYITEDACIGGEEHSTGYAEHVFDFANTAQIENLLLNLGRLDWRRANGDPSRSKLLDDIWRKLFTSDDSAAHLRAVTEVAFYQPARALDFAEKLLREGRNLRDLPTLFKYVAYSYNHLRRACEGLWEIGKGDIDTLNQSPGHGIRILAELCSVQPHKPLPYNEAFVDFGLSLLENPESWRHKYSPFDILKGILQTEGHTSTSSGMTISLDPFSVRPTVVTRLRRKVIDNAIRMLSHGDTRIAVLAARFLHDALRYPMGGVGPEARAAWTREFVETLNSIHTKMQEASLHSVVLVEIISSISWHANYAGGETGDIANNIIHSMPQTIEFRTIRAFIDGYGHWVKFEDASQLEREWNSYNELVVADLLSQFQDGETLRATLERYLVDIELYYGERIASPAVLYSQLAQHSASLARATAEDALLRKDSRTKRFAGIALSKLFKESRAIGLDIARRFLESGCSQLHSAIGEGYFSSDSSAVEMQDEIALLEEILGSSDVWVLRSATHAVRIIARQDNRLAIELLKSSNLGVSDKVANDFLMIFHGNEVLPFSSLTEKDVETLLSKLSLLPALEGFWIERFLASAAKRYPTSTLRFFIDRVEYATVNKDWSFRACNCGPYVNTPLQFRESGQLPSIFQQISQWIESRSPEDSLFHHWAAKLFEAIFQPFDDELIILLQTWIDKTTLSGIRIISKLLDEANPSFIFDQCPFVAGFLERCKQLGPEYLKHAINALYSSAVMGEFSGKLGEPYPCDVDMKRKAESVLENMPRFSAAYELYDAVKKRAEENIRTALQERIAFES
jgi:transcriptional regulator with XRE-family HTH domain